MSEVKTGIRSEDPKRCETCVHWENLRRKRTCRKDKNVKIGRKRVKGTPASYYCNEYSPLSVATCEECVHWTGARVKRKKDVCSNLSLPSPSRVGGVRKGSSIHCEKFNQQILMHPENNKSVRIDGVLATVLTPKLRSTEQALLLKTSEDAGLALRWYPGNNGGVGCWSVLPVEVLTSPEGVLSLRQHMGASGDVKDEISFSGKAELISLYGETAELRGQDVLNGVLRGNLRAHRKSILSGLRQVVFHVITRRKRPSKAFKEPAKGKSRLSKSRRAQRVVERLQDEPWGPYWSDLKEQVKNVTKASGDLKLSIVNVQRTFFEEHGIADIGAGKRLQKQLMVVLSPKKKNKKKKGKK